MNSTEMLKLCETSYKGYKEEKKRNGILISNDYYDPFSAGYMNGLFELITSPQSEIISRDERIGVLEKDNAQLKEAYLLMLNSMPLILKTISVDNLNDENMQDLINTVTKGAGQLLKIGFDLCGLKTHINATLEVGEDRFELNFVKLSNALNQTK